jgi:hypothetical protein
LTSIGGESATAQDGWRRPPVHLVADDLTSLQARIQEHLVSAWAVRDSRGPLTAGRDWPIRHKPYHVIVVGIVVGPRDPGRIGRASVSKRDDHDENGE